MIAVVLALFAAGSTLDAKGLRQLADSQRRSPQAAVEASPFRIELPIVPDRRTDLAAVQNSAGYSYDSKTGILSIDIDLAAMTPENFKSFGHLGLWDAPPLRILYFSTLTVRDTTFHATYDERGDAESSQGWRVSGESYGLAIPTSAQERGVKGGDLPDGFALPFVIQMRVPADRVGQTVRDLRVRVEGRLRTIGGRSVLCGRSGGGGYQVDEFTQRTPNVIAIQQCFLPAVVSSIALVRTTGGPPLKAWTRASLDPTPETADTRVLTTRDLVKPLPDGGPASSPNATAPLPKRP